MSNIIYDCIVIGKGPCGISTAIYLKRYGYNPIVIAKDNGSLEKAHLIENYYGFKSISGIELINNGIEQAKSLGIEIVSDEVLQIEPYDGISVECKNGIYKAKTLMLALGSQKGKLAIASKFEGVGVSYCATCDGFFYRKKKTCIIGNKDYMLHEYEVLKNMIPDLTIFTNGEELLVDVKDAKVVKEKIVSFNGDEKLESITTVNNTYEMDGAFIAIGSQTAFSLAKHIGIELDGNFIKVDSNMKTNIDGVYAGGDCVGGLLQVSKAVSDGAIAAAAIAKKLKNSN